jgi:arabinofuranosyltransferase
LDKRRKSVMTVLGEVEFMPRWMRTWVGSAWIPVSLALLMHVYFWSDSSFSRFHFPLDDTWIHQVYARSFAWFQGFAYNPGQQETGATSLLWVIVTAPLHWLTGSSPYPLAMAVKLWNAALTLIAVGLTYRLVRVTFDSYLIAVVAASVLATDSRWLFSSLSGMENVLLVTLWLGSVHQFLEQHWQRSSLLLGLCMVTRPELVLAGPIWLWRWYALPGPGQRPAWRTGLLVALWMGLPFLVWALFCQWVNGHWLPNTFYAKASSQFQMDRALLVKGWNILQAAGWWHLTWAAGAASLTFIAQALRRDTFFSKALLLHLFWIPLAIAIAILGTRGIHPSGYYWTRWLDFSAMSWTIAIGVGMGLWVQAIWALRAMGSRQVTCQAWTPARWLSVGIGVCGIALLLWEIPQFVETLEERRHRMTTDSRAIALINVATGEWIAQHTPRHILLGANDAGAVRYFGNRRTIDLVGLNHSEILFNPQKREEYLRERLDWVAIFPKWFTRYKHALEQYEIVQAFKIPRREYTICNCPGQTKNIIAKRK